MDDQFARDVLQGLSASPKYLSSKYFYDKKGDALFQQIMGLEEYYLTRCEYQILERYKGPILKQFQKSGKPFDLIEFGAGDGLKTKVLLEHFVRENAHFSYMPIDISANALGLLAGDLTKSLPTLNLKTRQGEYFSVLSHLESEKDRTKVVLFLGSNIGNFLKPVAVNFLRQISENLNTGDMILLGVDLVKDPKIIAKAYNDSQGVTRAFNLNLLHRINRELGGNFRPDRFIHWPVYDPTTGAARSFLVSTENQNIVIEKIKTSFDFQNWEPVQMELSQKYRLPDLETLVHRAGLRIVQHYFDENRYFTDGIWEVI